MTKKYLLILLFSLIVIGSIILVNQRLAHTQDLEPMPDNITLRIGETYSNMDLGIFFVFCGAQGNGLPPGQIELMGRILEVITSDIFGTDQTCELIFFEGQSIFFREFEYLVDDLTADSVFLVKQ